MKEAPKQAPSKKKLIDSDDEEFKGFGSVKQA